MSTENYRDIFVKNYLEDLIASIERLFPDYEAITLNKEIDAFTLDTKRLFPLGLIVNELITNCIKYGFRGKASGTIDIVLARQVQGITLTVQDDGDGFPENFDLKTSTGFGLRLVQMLTRQIKGTFTMSSDHGAKSVVTFEL
ncbi:MAG: hypothetical protein GY697_26005 [Desulfobacterales bacterium]|nr:hypothetical protein [Desulfobacterales bacterium]